MQIITALTCLWCGGAWEGSQRKGAWHAEGRRLALAEAQQGASGPRTKAQGQTVAGPCTLASEPPKQVHNDPQCGSSPYTCSRSVSLFLAGEQEIRLAKEVTHGGVR